MPARPAVPARVGRAGVAPLSAPTHPSVARRSGQPARVAPAPIPWQRREPRVRVASVMGPGPVRAVRTVARAALRGVSAPTPARPTPCGKRTAAASARRRRTAIASLAMPASGFIGGELRSVTPSVPAGAAHQRAPVLALTGGTVTRANRAPREPGVVGAHALSPVPPSGPGGPGTGVVLGPVDGLPALVLGLWVVPVNAPAPVAQTTLCETRLPRRVGQCPAESMVKKGSLRHCGVAAEELARRGVTGTSPPAQQALRLLGHLAHNLRR